MITFRNVSIDAAVPGIKIEDIRVSPIQLSPTVRTRPINPGSDFVRMVQEIRTVEITFGLIKQDPNQRRQAIANLTEWARSDTPQPMALPFHPGKLLDVICTALPEPSTRQWWESRLSLTFTAYDPFFYSIYEKSAACGNTAFFVAGDAPPRMRIEHTLSSAATDFYYNEGGRFMVFSQVPAGKLVIDLNEQTAAVAGTSIMQYWDYSNSAFILPKTGKHTIYGTGTVYWRERWEA